MGDGMEMRRMSVGWREREREKERESGVWECIGRLGKESAWHRLSGASILERLTPRLVAAYTDLLSFCVLFFFSFFIEEGAYGLCRALFLVLPSWLVFAMRRFGRDCAWKWRFYENSAIFA